MAGSPGLGAEIEVETLGRDEPMRFSVTLREAKDMTRHEVTLSKEMCRRLSDGRDAEEVIEAAFRFLLAREPKESILSSFDVSVIPRYFPEFDRELSSYFEPRS